MAKLRDPDFLGYAPLPEPTDVLPGPLKVAVLAERYARRQQLFSPDDPGYIHTDRAGLLLQTAANGAPSPVELVEQYANECTSQPVPHIPRVGR